MRTLSDQELHNLKGGSSQPVDYSAMSCAALQNYLGMFGSGLPQDQYNKLLDAIEIACFGGPIVITPGNPSTTTPDS